MFPRYVITVQFISYPTSGYRVFSVIEIAFQNKVQLQKSKTLLVASLKIQSGQSDCSGVNSEITLQRSIYGITAIDISLNLLNCIAVFYSYLQLKTVIIYSE